MPFHLVKIKRGWKVQDDKGNYYSKHPLPKKRATAQLRALYASYSRGESIRGKGYATYCDGDVHHLVLSGDGFFSDIFAKIKKVANTVASKFTTHNLQAVSEVLSTGIREDYPPDVRNVLAQYGQGQVYRLSITREPIKSYIDTVLNIISLGQWNAAKNKLNYDKMFHLSMVASLNMPNGDKKDVKIEKNEVINITPDIKTPKDAEVMPVPVPCCFTLQTMLDNAKREMGPPFFRYDAFANNCQSFILGILRANHLDKPEVVSFVSQDAMALMKELPEHIPAFASTLTNLAGFWNRLYKGQGAVFDARGVMKGGKLYCGSKPNVPAGYERKGTTGECFRKGVGVGLKLQRKEPPITVETLNGMTIRQLGQLASKVPIRGYSKMKRAELIEAITPHLAQINNPPAAEGSGRPLKGGAENEDGSWSGSLEEWQQAGFPGCGPNYAYDAQGSCVPVEKAAANRADTERYKDVAGVGTRWDTDDPMFQMALSQRHQQEEDAHQQVVSANGGLPPVPKWNDIPSFADDKVPADYTGYVRMGTYDESKPADEQWGRYNIIYYERGNVVRTGLQPGKGAIKYDLSGLRKKLEDTWGGQYGGLHYINPHQFTTTRNGETITYDENGNEKFDQNKHLSIDWLNTVEGRHLRDLNPYFEEWFQRAKEQDDVYNQRTPEQIAERDRQLEEKYQKEIEQRYDPNEDWITDMRGKSITDQYGNSQTLNKARLRSDGGFDIQYQNGKWDYMPGQDEWDCNAFMATGDRLENQGVCGTEGRKKAASQVEKHINEERDREWDGMSGWDKFVNGLNVAGAITEDYVMPIVSTVADFIPGAGFISTGIQVAQAATDAVRMATGTAGECRHFNECTEQMVNQGKAQALYHDTVGDRVANRFFSDGTMAELANHNDKVIPLLQDTYQYGSRAGKFEATGQGKPFYISAAFKKQLKGVGMTPEKYLEVVREIADEEGYDGRALEFADDDEHKLMIYDDEGHVHKFGRVGYDDYILWSKKEAIGKAPRGYAEQKRRVFNRSHSKLPGDWKKDKFSPNNLALKILW